MKIEWTWSESSGRWRAYSSEWTANAIQTATGNWRAWIYFGLDWPESHDWFCDSEASAKAAVHKFLDEQEELKALRDMRAAYAIVRRNTGVLSPEKMAETREATNALNMAFAATEKR